ncbi:hypothetical protein HD599_000225 [Conyzicola lurida]|uniref:Uncharacterized protein n=1 Tax=Conyzicola lurida TaxID=1172621 RepID=A0A841AIT6_9MICO|nr:hypothetical protein [Conyzicola lurida]MBB5841902.1 hypothetical protein [Conyzicola lurida]
MQPRAVGLHAQRPVDHGHGEPHLEAAAAAEEVVDASVDDVPGRSQRWREPATSKTPLPRPT